VADLDHRVIVDKPKPARTDAASSSDRRASTTGRVAVVPMQSAYRAIMAAALPVV